MASVFGAPFGMLGGEGALWDSGPGLVAAFGPRMGYQVITDKFGFIVQGEASAYLGIVYRDLEELGVPLGFTCAGMTRFIFPRVGFGLGGGITGAYFTTDDFFTDNAKDPYFYFYPYVELNVAAGKDLMKVMGKSYSIYTRYYFRDSDWYNRFSIGLRVN